MASSLSGGDLACTFELSDQAVVERHLLEGAVFESVQTAVAYVCGTEMQRAVGQLGGQHAHGDDGRSHAGEFWNCGAFRAYEPVRRDDGLFEFLDRVDGLGH